jgi:diaminopropionate ammonia-lyase
LVRVPTLLRDRSRGVAIDAPPHEPRAFHRALDGYASTPLVALPRLAAELGVARIDIKLEIDRLGLPSFKVMGASWATIDALRPVLPSSWRPDHGLVALAGVLPPLTLVAATEGNHGRALAWIARVLGLRARIFVPGDVTEARVGPIAAEGAEVVRVAGTYDDAVARSAADAQTDGHVLVSDTSWPGYERVPAAVIDGYSTILWEVEEQLDAAGRGAPDLVLVQLGVGSFGAAVIRHFRSAAGPTPRIVGVEPTAAACVMASLKADARITLVGQHESVMAGLNCGTPSLIAWPLLREGLDGVVAIDDAGALAGVRTLVAAGISVGECSGAAVAAVRELLAGPQAGVYRERLGLGPQASILLFATEGVTG